MIRRLFAFLLLSVFVYASDVEAVIYTKVLRTLFHNKPTIYVYKDDPKAFPKFHEPIVETDDPKKADILLIAHAQSLHHLPQNKPIFTNSYYLLLQYPNRIIGGFFWQKGRPNILLLTRTLSQYRLKLPKELEEFGDDTI